MGGSGLIWKVSDTCGAKRNFIYLVRLWSVWAWSRDNTSATSFSLPGNHWLKWQTRWSAIKSANSRASAEWDDCSPSAAKLDLRSHPSDDVLSPKLRKQSPAVPSPSYRDITIPAMQAKNSKKFMDFLFWASSGSSYLQALPVVSENPPSPRSQASVRRM